MISIIIPIYNKEKVLTRCLESILNQTYKDIQIILINDGSVDSSLRICQYFKEKHKEIVLIDKENGGVSSARNEGMKVATGDYIQFVDADDYLDSNTCEILIEKANEEKCDLICCGYKIIKRKKIVIKKCVNKTINRLDDISEEFSYLYRNYFFNTPCAKLYKREKIVNKFDENISLGEDLLFNLQYIRDIQKISFIELPLYNYMIESEDSLTSIYREDRLEIAIRLKKAIEEFSQEVFVSKYDSSAIDTIFIYDVIQAMLRLVIKSGMSRNWVKSSLFQIITREDVQGISKNLKLKELKYKIINLLIKYKMVNCIYLLLSIKKYI